MHGNNSATYCEGSAETTNCIKHKGGVPTPVIRLALPYSGSVPDGVNTPPNLEVAIPGAGCPLPCGHGIASLHPKTPFHGCFLGGIGKCDFPVPFIFNGLSPLKMPTLPCVGLVFAVSGRKLITATVSS